MRTPHTGCHRGKRVKVIKRDGSIIFDVFVDRTDRHIVLKNSGKLNKIDIRSFQIWKDK